MWNSLIIHTRILAKWTSGGHVSPSTGPRPGFLRPNGAHPGTTQGHALGSPSAKDS